CLAGATDHDPGPGAARPAHLSVHAQYVLCECPATVGRDARSRHADAAAGALVLPRRVLRGRCGLFGDGDPAYAVRDLGRTRDTPDNDGDDGRHQGAQSLRAAPVVRRTDVL